MATKIQSGVSTAGLANVDSNYQLRVGMETDGINNPSNISGIKIYSEIDRYYNGFYVFIITRSR